MADNGFEIKDTVTIKNETSSAQIHLLGACLFSWKVNDQEQIFVSKLARYKGPKAIRGGIPICWPQFSKQPSMPEKMAQHGFARISWWKAESVEGNKAVFVLKTNAISADVWDEDKKFTLRCTITLKGKSLETAMTVENNGDSAFDYQLCYHTYFRVPDVTKSRVVGLSGLKYIDKMRDAAVFVEEDKEISIIAEIDRIYESFPGKVFLNQDSASALKIDVNNLPDCVVWNPWIEKSKTMGDFDNEEYKNMICVEPGFCNPKSWVKLAGGQKVEHLQVFTVLTL